MGFPADLDAGRMGRALAAAWLAVGAALLAILLGGAAGEGDATALALLGAAAWAVGLALAMGAGRRWAFLALTQYAGIAIVAALVALSGDPHTPYALLFVWLAVQGACVDRWPRAIAQAIAAGCAYAAALSVAADGAFPWGRWLLTVVMLGVVGGLVAYTRTRMGALVTRLSDAAETDELTGLGNRRKLLAELETAVAAARSDAPLTLALFDLDGFKSYNDSFGHPAGDSLLMRMGRRLSDGVAPPGRAYRLGGDEFCLIVGGDATVRAAAIRRASAALAERGEGFEIGASCGRAEIPREACSADAALRLADARLHRQSIAAEPGRACLLSRMAPGADRRSETVMLAQRLGARLGLGGEELDVLARAAELQNIGKIAIPEDLLRSGGPFIATELELLRRHVEIGERLLLAAEPLGPVARAVRASRERWDGKGYPDGRAGDEIPLASRVIAVCQAFRTLTDQDRLGRARPAAAALAELRRSAGTRFDPAVVHALGALVAEDPPAADLTVAARGATVG